MGSIKRFMKYLKESSEHVLKNFETYLGSYIAFFFVNLLAMIPWKAFESLPGSAPETIVSIIVGILSLIVVVNIILIEKSRIKHREKEQLLYSVPTYLIYTLYSIITMLIGPVLVLFSLGAVHGMPKSVMIGSAAVVGIFVAIYVGMVSLASVLIDNDSVNYFKLSYRMGRLSPFLIFCFGFVTVLLEVPPFIFELASDWRYVLGINFLYAFFDSFASIVLIITSVRIFYHLKHQLNDQSE